MATLKNMALPDFDADPTAEQRIRSGVWSFHREESMERFGAIECWTLDKVKCNEKIHWLYCKDRVFAELMRTDPRLALDSRFGEGTYKAMMTAQDRTDHYREKRMIKDMALGRYYQNSGGTGTWTGTTTTSTSDTFLIDNSQFINDVIAQDVNRAVKKKTESIKLKRRPGIRVFRLGGRNLMNALQHDFNDYAGKYQRELFAA